MIKVKFEKSEDYDYLLAILDRYLEKLNDAAEIKEVCKLIELIDNEYEEV